MLSMDVVADESEEAALNEAIGEDPHPDDNRYGNFVQNNLWPPDSFSFSYQNQRRPRGSAKTSANFFFSRKKFSFKDFSSCFRYRNINRRDG